MSRFWGNQASDAESSEDENGDDVDAVQQPTTAPRFEFESSSEDEEKRVVRSQRDKRYEQLLDTVRVMKNHQKINDWTALHNDFELLNKQLANAKALVTKEGIPKFYFKALVGLENFMNEQYNQLKSEGKKMSQSNQKALNTMRQKLKKHRKKYEKEYEDYEKAPLASDAEDDEPEPKDDDNEDEPEKKTKKPKKKKAKRDDDDDDDESEPEDEDVDGSDEDDGDVEALDTKVITRDFWVKKEKAEPTHTSGYVRKTSKPTGTKKKRYESDEEADQKEEVKKKEIEYTHEMIMNKLMEISSNYGRRGVNKLATIDELRMLATKTREPAALLKVKCTLARALFDVSQNTASYMPVERWRDCFECLQDVVVQLRENPSVRLSEDDLVEEDFAVDEEEKRKTEDEKMPSEQEAAAAAEREKQLQDQGKEKGVKYVLGNMYSFIWLLYSEYIKSLQNIDPHTPEYVTRLKDEFKLAGLVEKAHDYYRKIEKKEFEAKVALLRLELVYYLYRPEQDALRKVEAVAAAKATGAAAPTEAKSAPLLSGISDKLVEELVSFLYHHGEQRSKTRALLCHVYYLALHNHWERAKDLFLMSHVQDTISTADVRTRILFNRTMAQLGLCAFRVGEFAQALDCLNELFSTNKVKELIAQGISQYRWNERDEAKEKVEKMRLYPYHMHMNQDMLESVHLLSAMMFEVPLLAVTTDKNRAKSKTFRRLYDNHTRQAFNGPPENTRENVMAATKALQRGDWEQCLQHLLRLKLWDLLSTKHHTKGIVAQRIREVALRTYLLTFGGNYTSMSMASLMSMFDLAEPDVYRIVCTMMMKDQLKAAWDQPSRCLVINAMDVNRLQQAALEYADKAALFVELNEKLMDQRGFYKGDKKGGWNDGGGYGNSQRGGRNNRGRQTRFRNFGERAPEGEFQ